MKQTQTSAAIRHRVASDRVKAGHPEAIAVRRLVIARGAWLSPLFANLPLPELTPWEASCDLVSALNTWLSHEQRKVRDQETRTRNGGGRTRSQDTPTLREVQAIRRYGKQGAKGRFTKAEPLALPTVDPAMAAPLEAKGWVGIKETGPRHSTRKAPPARHALTEEEKAAAVVRIAAIAAEKAAKEQELEAKKAAAEANREARRKETAKAASEAYNKRMREKRVKDAAYAKAYGEKRRAQERARNEERRAATAARKAKANTPEAISARKAKEYARRRDLHLARMANDPDYASKWKAKAAAKERLRTAKERAAKEEAAKVKLQEVAEGIAAKARAKRKARSNAKQAARQTLTSGGEK